MNQHYVNAHNHEHIISVYGLGHYHHVPQTSVSYHEYHLTDTTHTMLSHPEEFHTHNRWDATDEMQATVVSLVTRQKHALDHLGLHQYHAFVGQHHSIGPLAMSSQQKLCCETETETETYVLACLNVIYVIIIIFYFFTFSRCSRCRTRINSLHTMGGLPRLNCTSLAFRVLISMSAK